jgi:hypothetical protein
MESASLALLAREVRRSMLLLAKSERVVLAWASPALEPGRVVAVAL